MAVATVNYTVNHGPLTLITLLPNFKHLLTEMLNSSDEMATVLLQRVIWNLVVYYLSQVY